MAETIKLTSKAKALLSSDKIYNLITGGRIGGKTKTAAIISTLFAFQFPNTDQIYCRASYGSMADSCFAEYKDALDSLPNGLGNEFSERRSPLRFERGASFGELERRMPEMYAKRELPPIRPEAPEAPSIKIELINPESDSERMLKLERETLAEIDGKVMEK